MAALSFHSISGKLFVIQWRSVVFVAQNLAGAENDQREYGCHLNIEEQRLMPRDKGIIRCYSLDGLKNRKEAKFFMLPPISDDCNPSERGDFLDQYLRDGIKGNSPDLLDSALTYQLIHH